MAISDIISHQALQTTQDYFNVLANKKRAEPFEALISVITTSQGFFGFGLGIALYQIIKPLIMKSLEWLGHKKLADSFNNKYFYVLASDFIPLIIIAPLAIMIAPVVEEVIFREHIFEIIKSKLYDCLAIIGCCRPLALLAARIGTLFFSSILFGLVHFSNALFFLRRPFDFLPQVIGASYVALPLGLLKEATGTVTMAIGAHCGYNAAYIAEKIGELIEGIIRQIKQRNFLKRQSCFFIDKQSKT